MKKLLVALLFMLVAMGASAQSGEKKVLGTIIEIHAIVVGSSQTTAMSQLDMRTGDWCIYHENTGYNLGMSTFSYVGGIPMGDAAVFPVVPNLYWSANGAGFAALNLKFEDGSSSGTVKLIRFKTRN